MAATRPLTAFVYEQDDGTLVIYRCPVCGSTGEEGGRCRDGHSVPVAYRPGFQGFRRKPVRVPGVEEKPRSTLEQVTAGLLFELKYGVDARDNRIAEALYWLGGGDSEAAEAALKDLERIPAPGFTQHPSGGQEGGAGKCVIDGCELPGGHKGPHKAWRIIDAPYLEDREHVEPWEDEVAREIAAEPGTEGGVEEGADRG